MEPDAKVGKRRDSLPTDAADEACSDGQQKAGECGDRGFTGVSRA